MADSPRFKHALPIASWPSEEEAKRALLFQPIRIGRSMQLLQRTWVPAMVPWRAQISGEVTEELIAWYGRFAAGKPGAIVVEATGIRDVPSGPLLRINDDRFILGLSKLADVVRRRSEGQTRVLIQIIDFMAIKRRPTREAYLQRYLKIEDAHREKFSELSGEDWTRSGEVELRAKLCSLEDALLFRVLSRREIEDLEFGYRERVWDTHLPHIRELPKILPEAFGRAALRAEKAGFDGVELHFAHAYTMASFLSRLNDRTDEYGGSPSARVRLPLEVIAAARSLLSKDTALGCRFLSDEVIAGGSRLDDATFYAVELARAGLDFLSLSKGGKFEDAKQPKIGEAAYPYTGESGHECMPTVYADGAGPFGRHLPLARAIRRAVRSAGFQTPIIAAGAINTFELAESALQNGDADVIAAARQSLADPDWFSKMKRGQGDRIRRCQATNYCEGLDQKHKQVTCRLWDRDFSEEERASILTSADGKRRLVAP